LVSDGRVFNDICLIPDEDVSNYNKCLQKMRPNLEEYVSFIGLEDLLETGDSFTGVREKLEYLYGKTDQEI
jgi:pyoverdine/dityrosine biosynthesis protein Dit1